MAVIGYVYCQVAQQFMDRFLGLGSVFAKVAEKGHRFKACVGESVRVCDFCTDKRGRTTCRH